MQIPHSFLDDTGITMKVGSLPRQRACWDHCVPWRSAHDPVLQAVLLLAVIGVANAGYYGVPAILETGSSSHHRAQDVSQSDNGTIPSVSRLSLACTISPAHAWL